MHTARCCAELQASFHEIESLRQKNVELTEEVERLRSHTESLQNEGYTLRSQFSVVETSKSVTNKVCKGPADSHPYACPK